MIRNGATRQNVLFKWKEVLQDERQNNFDIFMSSKRYFTEVFPDET